MWKAAYYKKQEQICLALAQLARDKRKAAMYALAASQYHEEAERVVRDTALKPAA